MDAPVSLTLQAEDEAAMLALGRAVAAAAGPWLRGGILIDLRGDLGMGKTVFVRGVAAGLGVPPSQAVVSPTFTIARSYEGEHATLHHLDAYRLGGLEDLEAAGFEEMWGEGIVTCVEWGARVVEALPADRLEVSLDMDPDAGPVRAPEPGGVPVFPRRVVFVAHGPRARALLAAFEAAHRAHGVSESS
ncbi:MAG: tRNA (adenosine(37)-N6)-threonylcarbamoyltransferase complex ATPase subunit type 1 TsaE [Planctomycetota bacterium]|nr:tRNA (adenosine(37)-N6)-threonylcarbamoyltransferase complex ATPase subunit type 1 TsaE [Planctomycetota bacterium]